MNFRIACLALLLLLVPSTALAQSLSAARSRVTQAQEAIKSERFDQVESLLATAEKYLQGLTDAEKASVLADIAATRVSLAAAIKAEEARRVRGSFERDINAAETYVKDQPEYAETRLKGIEARLAGGDAKKSLGEADLAALKARIAEVRGKMGGAGAPAPAKPAAAPAAPAGAAAPTGADCNLTAAKSRVNQCKTLIETGRLENIEAILEEAAKFMEGCPEADKAPVLADMAGVRASLAQAEKAEQKRVLTEQVDRYLRGAEGSIEAHSIQVPELLKKVGERLDSGDAKRLLTPEEIAQYRARHAEITKALAAHEKAFWLDRAQGFLARLEELLSGDPYAGKDSMEAYKTAREIAYLERAVKNNLADIPKGDADAQGVLDKLGVLKKKADAASSSWTTAQVEAALRDGWGFAMSNAEGWEEEVHDKDLRPHERWRLGKTIAALRGANYWLNDEQIRKMKADQPGSAVVKEIFANAEKTRDAAAARLDREFNESMGEVEKLPTPRNRFDRVIAEWMANDAESVFDGTKYKKANVDRAKALDARWEREIEALRKAAEARLKQLTDDANRRWPGIVDDLDPEAKFEMSDLARSRGDRIIIRNVYDRAGWDFSADYDFAARIDGVAIAGNFEPWVNKEIQDVWEKNQAPPLSDREAWDIIGVVVGRGVIKRRVTTNIIAADTREIIGRIEGHEAEDGVIIRIIGLRAGPIAVGRK